MKRLIALAIALIAAISGVYILQRTAIDPDLYTGDWYRVQDEKIYHFQDGLIMPLEGVPEFAGAYSFCTDRILLFVKEADGNSRVCELYPAGDPKGEFLSESDTGTGKIVFSRKRLR